MARTKQLPLLKDPRKNTKLWWIVKQHVYGGSLNYRKVRRPFDSKKLVHVVFKARLGKSLWFTGSERMVREVITAAAARYGVRVRDVAVSRDHIHVFFYTGARESQTLFLRFVSCELGRKHKAIRKSLGLAASPLWIARPFTRLVPWGTRSVERISRYFQQNRNEAMGFVEYKPRNHALTGFLLKWQAQFSSA